ncbi:MAG: hypothetical protein A4E66_02510 [Syntrophus sp. PtaB.Bin001]|nr:MAG: hypothetical protein A4E66_02510 [Syntrophus sp. PtaB.Bin001]
MKDFIKIAQTIAICVNNRHMSPHSQCHLCGIAADYSASKHHDVSRTDPWHSAEQLSPTSIFLFQIVSNDLGRHTPGNLRHGHQQWQNPAVVLDGFISN